MTEPRDEETTTGYQSSDVQPAQPAQPADSWGTTEPIGGAPAMPDAPAPPAPDLSSIGVPSMDDAAADVAAVGSEATSSQPDPNAAGWAMPPAAAGAMAAAPPPPPPPPPGADPYQQPAAQPQTWTQPAAYQQQQQQPYPQQQPYQPYQQQQPYPPQQPYPQQQPPYPPQPQAWGQQPAGYPPNQSYWGQGQPQYTYGSSALAVLAGIPLLLFGLLAVLGGVGIIVVGQAANMLVDAGFTQSTADSLKGIFVVLGAVVLVVGVLEVLASLGIWLHKSWGRVLGILFGVLGTLFGVLAVIGTLNARTLDDGTRVDARGSLGFAIAILVIYAFIFLALIVGGRHFSKQRVA